MHVGELLDVSAPKEFGAWLAAHGAARREIWVVVYKKSSGKQQVTYAELVEVGLCHGWIDGTIKSLDAERYAQRFSPRRPRGNWTPGNRLLALRLLREGRMTPAGYAALPDDIRLAVERDERG